MSYLLYACWVSTPTLGFASLLLLDWEEYRLVGNNLAVEGLHYIGDLELALL